MTRFSKLSKPSGKCCASLRSPAARPHSQRCFPAAINPSLASELASLSAEEIRLRSIFLVQRAPNKKNKHSIHAQIIRQIGNRRLRCPSTKNLNRWEYLFKKLHRLLLPLYPTCVPAISFSFRVTSPGKTASLCPASSARSSTPPREKKPPAASPSN